MYIYIYNVQYLYLYIYKGEALMKQQDLDILEKHRKEKEEAASLAAAQV